MSWGRKEGLCDPLGVGSEMKVRAQQAFYHRAGDITGGMGTRETERDMRSAVSPPVSLAEWAFGLAEAPIPFFYLCWEQQCCYNNALCLLFCKSVTAFVTVHLCDIHPYNRLLSLL